MTDSDSTGGSKLVKTDVMGRLRTTRKQREALLDAFDQGGLSGPDFARVHGIKYQTFATWRQRRKRERGEYCKAAAKKPENFTLVEVAEDRAEAAPGHSESALRVELPGSGVLMIRDSGGVSLAVEFMIKLQSERRAGC